MSVAVGGDDDAILAVGHAGCEGIYGHSRAVDPVSSYVIMIGLPGTTVLMSMPSALGI